MVPPEPILFFKTSTIAILSFFNSCFLIVLASLKGDMPAAKRLSSAYIFPIPAIIVWSNKIDFMDLDLFEITFVR